MTRFRFLTQVLSCAGVLFFAGWSVPLAAEGDFGSGVTVVGVKSKGGATIYDVSWPSHREKWNTVQAWVVVPTELRPGPGVLFFHQLGQQRDRNQFLYEATDLASQGIRSLCINGSAPWNEGWKGTAEDATMIEAQLADVEAAVAVLRSVPGTGKLGFVGHDYGAMFGALLYGRSTSFSAYVLIAPTASFSDWIFFANREAGADPLGYAAKLEGREPRLALAGPVKHPLLFQFAKSDVYVSTLRAQELSALVPGSVTQVFLASHNSVSDKGRADRQSWLIPFLVERSSPRQ